MAQHQPLTYHRMSHAKNSGKHVFVFPLFFHVFPFFFFSPFLCFFLSFFPFFPHSLFLLFPFFLFFFFFFSLLFSFFFSLFLLFFPFLFFFFSCSLVPLFPCSLVLFFSCSLIVFFSCSLVLLCFFSKKNNTDAETALASSLQAMMTRDKLSDCLGLFIQRLKSRVWKPEKRWTSASRQFVWLNRRKNSQFPQFEWRDIQAEEPNPE